MTERVMTAEEVRAMLRTEVEQAGSQDAWAKRHGLSQVTVSHTIIGYRRIGPKIAAALGLELIMGWREKAVDANAKGN